jgi:hypothetical protein
VEWESRVDAMLKLVMGGWTSRGSRDGGVSPSRLQRQANREVCYAVKMYIGEVMRQRREWKRKVGVRASEGVRAESGGGERSEVVGGLGTDREERVVRVARQPSRRPRIDAGRGRLRQSWGEEVRRTRSAPQLRRSLGGGTRKRTATSAKTVRFATHRRPAAQVTLRRHLSVMQAAE